MRPVWIAKAAAVTALGDGVEALWRGVAEGRTGIAPVTRFPVAGYASSLAALVPGLDPQGPRPRVLSLLDRLAEELGPVPPGCRLLAATTKGAIESWERLRRGEPADPALVPIPGLLGEVGRRFGTAGPAHNVSAACASSTVAVGRGAAWVAAGRAEAVLICAFDAITEFVFSGFSSLKALDPGPCRPFDRDRRGLTLGEGAAALLLVSPEEAGRRGLEPLGTVQGWGAANDAHHLTAPARDGAGLLLAVRRALAVAGLGPEDLGAVSAHGTGTVYNDAMELTAFRALLGERRMPLHSVKGAVGHTLGAAGALEVILALQALQRGVIPPTVGFEHPESGAEGRVSAASQPLVGASILSTNSGFGGVNACLVVGGAVRASRPRRAGPCLWLGVGGRSAGTWLFARRSERKLANSRDGYGRSADQRLRSAASPAPSTGAESAVERAIRKLREAGRLVRVGPDKGGHWQVIE